MVKNASFIHEKTNHHDREQCLDIQQLYDEELTDDNQRSANF